MYRPILVYFTFAMLSVFSVGTVLAITQDQSRVIPVLKTQFLSVISQFLSVPIRCPTAAPSVARSVAHRGLASRSAPGTNAGLAGDRPSSL